MYIYFGYGWILYETGDNLNDNQTDTHANLICKYGIYAESITWMKKHMAKKGFFNVKFILE